MQNLILVSRSDLTNLAHVIRQGIRYSTVLAPELIKSPGIELLTKSAELLEDTAQDDALPFIMPSKN